jgi:hypothetical protein
MLVQTRGLTRCQRPSGIGGGPRRLPGKRRVRDPNTSAIAVVWICSECVAPMAETLAEEPYIDVLATLGRVTVFVGQLHARPFLSHLTSCRAASPCQRGRRQRVSSGWVALCPGGVW